MTYEFNVDRFYAQLGTFSFFVISYDSGIKLGSNWNSWPMNLMLIDFTPNWALFLFLSIHMIEGWNLDQIESHDPGFSCWQILRPIGRFSIFVISFDRGIKLGSNWNSWPMNLLLTDFTPNWALFLFSLFHILERWNLDQIESHDLWI